MTRGHVFTNGQVLTPKGEFEQLNLLVQDGILAGKGYLPDEDESVLTVHDISKQWVVPGIVAFGHGDGVSVPITLLEPDDEGCASHVALMPLEWLADIDKISAFDPGRLVGFWCTDAQLSTLPDAHIQLLKMVGLPILVRLTPEGFEHLDVGVTRLISDGVRVMVGPPNFSEQLPELLAIQSRGDGVMLCVDVADFFGEFSQDVISLCHLGAIGAFASIRQPAKTMAMLAAIPDKMEISMAPLLLMVSTAWAAFFNLKPLGLSLAPSFTVFSSDFSHQDSKKNRICYTVSHGRLTGEKKDIDCG